MRLISSKRPSESINPVAGAANSRFIDGPSGNRILPGTYPGRGARALFGLRRGRVTVENVIRDLPIRPHPLEHQDILACLDRSDAGDCL
jgi:hypothetical protein